MPSAGTARPPQQQWVLNSGFARRIWFYSPSFPHWVHFSPWSPWEHAFSSPLTIALKTFTVVLFEFFVAISAAYMVGLSVWLSTFITVFLCVPCHTWDFGVAWSFCKANSCSRQPLCSSAFSRAFPSEGHPHRIGKQKVLVWRAGGNKKVKRIISTLQVAITERVLPHLLHQPSVKPQSSSSSSGCPGEGWPEWGGCNLLRCTRGKPSLKSERSVPRGQFLWLWCAVQGLSLTKVCG